MTTRDHDHLGFGRRGCYPDPNPDNYLAGDSLSEARPAEVAWVDDEGRPVETVQAEFVDPRTHQWLEQLMRDPRTVKGPLP